MKVILQDDGDLVSQARIAQLALAAGRPHEGADQFRVSGNTGPPPRHYVVRYNKASLTVYPQQEPRP